MSDNVEYLKESIENPNNKSILELTTKNIPGITRLTEHYTATANAYTDTNMKATHNYLKAYKMAREFKEQMYPNVSIEEAAKYHALLKAEVKK